MVLILGVDAGNDGAKVCGEYGLDKSNTAICSWFERNVKESFGDDDTEFEIDGRKGFAGTIAKYEDEFGGGSMFGDSKAHDDTKIRVLLAISRYIKKYEVNKNKVRIVVGQPIKTHKDSEKQKIKDMLIGEHSFKVDGQNEFIHIENVEVATEGGAAFWSQPEQGVLRIIDCGSGTVNAASIDDARLINNASGTFNFGAETIKNKNDMDGMARGIIQNTTRLKWSRDDAVHVCGGIADRVAPFLQIHYSDVKILQPTFQHQGGVTVAHPVYANSIGFYNIARGLYGGA